MNKKINSINCKDGVKLIFFYEIFKGIAKHRAAVGEKRRGSRATGTQTAQGHIAAQSGGLSAMHKKEVHRDGAMFSGGG